MQREAILVGGQAVLIARALHPERSLADHYNPLAMAPDLLRAHRQLDAAVDKAFGLRGTVTDDMRLRALFMSYQQLITANELTMPSKPKCRRAAKTPV